MRRSQHRKLRESSKGDRRKAKGTWYTGKQIRERFKEKEVATLVNVMDRKTMMRAEN